MVKVTVLVAVYNAEQTLPLCLDSLKAQTMGDIQVVCIDDASTDGSWGVLQEYASADSRIELVRLAENVGQAKARNIGLRQARGNYVCFLDSDDWFSPDALGRVVERFESDEQIDSVLFVCRYVYPLEAGSYLMPGKASGGVRTEDFAMPSFDTMPGNQAFELSLTWKIHGVCAVKLPIHQRFPYDEAAHFASDDNTTRFHYLVSRKVALCTGVYYYRQHEASAVHQLTVRRFDYLAANISLKQQMEKMGVEDRLLDEYENVRWLNMLYLCSFYMDNSCRFTSADRRRALEMLQNSWRSIEIRRLSWRNHYKFGLFPFRLSWLPMRVGWTLFRIEETIYFGLKRLFAKLR